MRLVNQVDIFSSYLFRIISHLWCDKSYLARMVGFGDWWHYMMALFFFNVQEQTTQSTETHGQDVCTNYYQILDDD